MLKLKGIQIPLRLCNYKALNCNSVTKVFCSCPDSVFKTPLNSGLTWPATFYALPLTCNFNASTKACLSH